MTENLIKYAFNCSPKDAAKQLKRLIKKTSDNTCVLLDQEGRKIQTFTGTTQAEAEQQAIAAEINRRITAQVNRKVVIENNKVFVNGEALPLSEYEREIDASFEGSTDE